MEQQTLNVYIRETLKKGSAGKLRREGKIPAIVYGRGEPTPIAVDAREFGNKFHTVSESTLITLQADGKSFDVLVKDYQSDILSGKILHIDFYEIEKGKALRARVALHLVGTPIGVREGGVVEQLMHDVEVECLPKDLPAGIEIDVSNVKIGSSLTIADVAFPEGVRPITPEDQVVMTVTVVRAARTAAETEAAESAEAETPATGA
jgi:large subunit ribosomal protein L25